MADDPKTEYEARKKATAESNAKTWADSTAMTPTPTQEENDLAAMGLLPQGPAAAPEPAHRSVPRHEPAQPHRATSQG